MDSYYQGQPQQFNAPNHHDSFSGASTASATTAGYTPFTPVSGRSSPASRMGSVASGCDTFDPTVAGTVAPSTFPAISMDMSTPPSSTSFFNLSLNNGSAAAQAQAAPAAPDMGTTSYFPGGAPSAQYSHGPVTPGGHHSSIVNSPTSPANTQQNMMPYITYADSYQQQRVRTQQTATPPYQLFPTPPPTHQQGNMAGSSQAGNDCGEFSPSEFYWHGQNRESPPLVNFFEDSNRPNLPLPPPPASIQLRSQTGSIRRDVVGYGEDRYTTAPAPISPSNIGSRRMPMDGAQLKTATLHRHITSRHHPYASAHMSRPRYSPYSNPAVDGQIITRNGIQVSKVASGAFKCLVPGCQAHPFKRSEHLKRHVTTHHENKDVFPCEFCGRNFNRKDNWRSHLKLHTVSRGKNARTDFFPKAVEVYNAEMLKVSKCRPRKDKNLYQS